MFPQWKIDLFRSRNALVCTCYERWMPESQSTLVTFNPDCPVHGDADTRAGRSIVENDAIERERRV